MSDMTAGMLEPRTRAALLDSQRRVLERIARGAPLAEILETLVTLIEEQAQGMRCAVLLANPERERLRFAAAPSIPEDYKAGIEPFLRIAPNMGSCGTAAFLREPVYTSDTACDVLWKDCGHIAVRNGLRAIWSTPILSDDGAVLGTFAMYYGEPRLPLAEHIQLIDMATQMVRVAIQRTQAEERLRASEEKLRLIAENARDLFVLVDSTGTRNAGLAGSDAKERAPESLSSQEKRVLALVAEGKTNKEIAAALGLSDKTVKNYLSRVFEKLQVGRRAHAAAIYRQSNPE
ncbi:MAG TPA: LuxR C-terminal-related transcriptional regulator [Burkholderiales bacterium]|jgi:DNA-binding CsgD family transcriptional regulator/PAS domain-containing protein|nr:LuxR C-terminal-related transcriptional regulator [Burkholderiales bacterium]